jgi:dihydrodipicolinate synthase/N-acetylneuraminate lyase
LDETRQRALTRYYCASGVGGLAVGVHTTQFEIHAPQAGLLRPVLDVVSETIDETLVAAPRPFIKIAGLVGKTEQALMEAELALDCGYHAALVSLSAFPDASYKELVTHCQRIAERIPLIGFYLQPAVGGRVLDYDFWRALVDIEGVCAIKIAPFDRYKTLDVVRAVADAGRADDIALYTGNDDNILADLVTTFHFGSQREQDATSSVHIVGGLLGQWAVWTAEAVKTLECIKDQRKQGSIDYAHWLTYGVHMTDANGAIFDVKNRFHGCISGIHEILRRQGLMAGTWCFNPQESLSRGQDAELDRICAAYPHLTDDTFVAQHLDEWLR